MGDWADAGLPRGHPDKPRKGKLVVVSTPSGFHDFYGGPHVAKSLDDAYDQAGNATYLAILGYMHQLHIAKARGYSGAGPDTWQNFRKATTAGVSVIQGVHVRLLDKESRRDNLLADRDNDKLVGENLVRTLIDTASYNLILACLIAEDDPDLLVEAMRELK